MALIITNQGNSKFTREITSLFKNWIRKQNRGLSDVKKLSVFLDRLLVLFIEEHGGIWGIELKYNLDRKSAYELMEYVMANKQQSGTLELLDLGMPAKPGTAFDSDQENELRALIKDLVVKGEIEVLIQAITHLMLVCMIHSSDHDDEFGAHEIIGKIIVDLIKGTKTTPKSIHFQQCGVGIPIQIFSQLFDNPSISAFEQKESSFRCLMVYSFFYRMTGKLPFSVSLPSMGSQLNSVKKPFDLIVYDFTRVELGSTEIEISLHQLDELLSANGHAFFLVPEAFLIKHSIKGIIYNELFFDFLLNKLSTGHLAGLIEFPSSTRGRAEYNKSQKTIVWISKSKVSQIVIAYQNLEQRQPLSSNLRSTGNSSENKRLNIQRLVAEQHNIKYQSRVYYCLDGRFNFHVFQPYASQFNSNFLSGDSPQKFFPRSIANKLLETSKYHSAASAKFSGIEFISEQTMAWLEENNISMLEPKIEEQIHMLNKQLRHKY